MSLYSTGEIAKAAGVTVRTVQYYDTKRILIPYDYSEGGRRVYTDEELEKLKLICFLKDLGLSLENIATILTSENAEKVVITLLEEQEKNLSEQIRDMEDRKGKIISIRKQMGDWNDTSIKTIKDMAYVMSNEKELEKMYRKMFCFAMPMEAVEVATFMVGILKGIWIPFIVCMVIILCFAPVIVNWFLKRTVYICPECHEVFRPGMTEFMFASHTAKTRILKCPHCLHKGFCVETYGSVKEEA